MKFTDLLDDYLRQKERVERLQEGLLNRDVLFREVADLDKVKDALNDAFESGLT